MSPQSRHSVLTCNQQQLSHRSTWNQAADFIYRKFSVDFSFSKTERLEQKTKKKKQNQSERNFLGSARSKGGSGKGVLSGWDNGWVGWTLGLHGEARLSGEGAVPDT